MSECWTARSMDGRCCVAVSLCSLVSLARSSVSLVGPPNTVAPIDTAYCVVVYPMAPMEGSQVALSRHLDDSSPWMFYVNSLLLLFLGGPAAKTLGPTLLVVLGYSHCVLAFVVPVAASFVFLVRVGVITREPVAWYNALSYELVVPASALIGGLVVAALLVWDSRRGRSPWIVLAYILGCFVLGLVVVGFVQMSLPTSLGTAHRKVVCSWPRDLEPQYCVELREAELAALSRKALNNTEVEQRLSRALDYRKIVGQDLQVLSHTSNLCSVS